ncbi:Adenosylhomocysteinase [Frankliniella fusca]|uniref:Adenosylhomocysteinase n=1 Tax=Frankliniella fusca TaxID=407009 RepID=A0AAE1LG05_9NEOP|nr:Adenosylhomocysteinase [Frankliniella fusca]
MRPAVGCGAACRGRAGAGAGALVDARASPSLCDRYTRWDEDGLRALHQAFRQQRLRAAEAGAAFVPLTRRRRPRQQDKLTQPADLGALFSRAGASQEAEVLLQSAVRGRAAQTHMWEELARQRDAVEEVMDALGPGPGPLSAPQARGPAPRPPTPRLYHERRQEPAPQLFTQLKDIGLADVVEAITEKIMLLRVQGPQQATPAARASASTDRSEVGVGGEL